MNEQRGMLKETSLWGGAMLGKRGREGWKPSPLYFVAFNHLGTIAHLRMSLASRDQTREGSLGKPH